MYYKHKEWLEQTKIDDEVERLRKLRWMRKLTIYGLRAEVMKIQIILGHVSAQLQKAYDLHKEVDEELSMIDGRFKILPPHKPEKIKKPKKSMKKTIKELSPEERKKLIAELQAMK